MRLATIQIWRQLSTIPCIFFFANLLFAVEQGFPINIKLGHRLSVERGKEYYRAEAICQTSNQVKAQISLLRVSTKLEKDGMKNTWVKTTLPRNLEIVFSV